MKVVLSWIIQHLWKQHNQCEWTKPQGPTLQVPDIVKVITVNMTRTKFFLSYRALKGVLRGTCDNSNLYRGSIKMWPCFYFSWCPCVRTLLSDVTENTTMALFGQIYNSAVNRQRGLWLH